MDFLRFSLGFSFPTLGYLVYKKKEEKPLPIICVWNLDGKVKKLINKPSANGKNIFAHKQTLQILAHRKAKSWFI